MRTLPLILALAVAAPGWTGRAAGRPAAHAAQAGLVTTKNDRLGFEITAPAAWTRLRTEAGDPAAVFTTGALPIALAPGNAIEDITLPWNAVIYNAFDPFGDPPPGPYVDLVVHSRTQAQVQACAAAFEKLLAESFRIRIDRVNREFKTAGGEGLDYAHLYAKRQMRWVMLFGADKQAVLKADMGANPTPEALAQVEAVVQSIRLRPVR